VCARARASFERPNEEGGTDETTFSVILDFIFFFFSVGEREQKKGKNQSFVFFFFLL